MTQPWSGSGGACERTSESGNAIAVLRTKRTPAGSVDAAGVPMLVRGPLGPPDIICANRVANGLTGDSRGSMKSGRLGAIRWRGFQKGAKKPHEIACSCGFYSGLRNRCTGWLRLPRPADVMRMLLQRPLQNRAFTCTHGNGCPQRSRTWTRLRTRRCGRSAGFLVWVKLSPCQLVPRANAFVSNSAGVDQCQSLNRRPRGCKLKTCLRRSPYC